MILSLVKQNKFEYFTNMLLLKIHDFAKVSQKTMPIFKSFQPVKRDITLWSCHSIFQGAYNGFS